jgi:AcrR family transcriptional regulator
MSGETEPSLRDRKKRKNRDAIVEAAMSLFAERGFDEVTVADIAHRAEVSRSTFFRYFTDKRDVLFDDGGAACAALVEASERVAEDLAPLGDSLVNALLVSRAGITTLSRQIGSDPAGLARRDRIIESHPELQARNLAKERAYVAAGMEVLLWHGATLETATLAAHLAAACFGSARVLSASTGGDLTVLLERELDRLGALTANAVPAAAE